MGQKLWKQLGIKPKIDKFKRFKFSSETRPRRDKFQNLVRDRDKTESLSTFSLKTETRPKLSSFTVGLFEAKPPKYHISTAWAKRSGANAWASAHALSMVMWYHQKIVNGYCLFKPLLLWVFIMNLQIVVCQCLVVPLMDTSCPGSEQVPPLPLGWFF